MQTQAKDLLKQFIGTNRDSSSTTVQSGYDRVSFEVRVIQNGAGQEWRQDRAGCGWQ